MLTVGSSEDVKSADLNKLNMSRRSKPVAKAMSPNRQGPQQCLVSTYIIYTQYILYIIVYVANCEISTIHDSIFRFYMRPIISLWLFINARITKAIENNKPLYCFSVKQ